MKNKSFFLLIILSLLCIIATVGMALLAGSYKTAIIDFSNLNYSNVILVLIAGGFITCIVVGMTVLFAAKSIFLKIKEYLTGTNENHGGNKK